ncbi:MAG: hypothetical protein QOE36_3441 [Gaiellaceae bacterium]|nr:hypothetical protein [Gaiellaceae bacterium]
MRTLRRFPLPQLGSVRFTARVRVALIVRSLVHGGSERQLVSLASGLRERGHEVAVGTLRGGDAFAEDLRSADVTRLDARIRRRSDAARLAAFLRELRRRRPEVVYGFHPESNLAALAFGRALTGCRVVWGVRWSDGDRFPEDRTARVLKSVSDRLARLPDLVIAGSEAGRRDALSSGFDPSRTIHIDPGFDTQRFHRDEHGRSRVRAEWGVSNEPLVGMVARLVPVKDWPTFLRAAALLGRRRPDVRFAAVGGGPRDHESLQRRLATELGLGGRIVWAGLRSDMQAVYSALDVCTLASRFGEGVPNVLGEAMACEVACVATDSGDTRRLLDGVGRVVPPGDPAALAGAWEAALENGSSPAYASRERVVTRFARERMILETEAALAEIVRPRPR